MKEYEVRFRVTDTIREFRVIQTDDTVEEIISDIEHEFAISRL